LIVMMMGAAWSFAWDDSTLDFGRASFQPLGSNESKEGRCQSLWQRPGSPLATPQLGSNESKEGTFAEANRDVCRGKPTDGRRRHGAAVLSSLLSQTATVSLRLSSEQSHNRIRCCCLLLQHHLSTTLPPLWFVISHIPFQIHHHHVLETQQEGDCCHY
jgi:hypothetical protein